MRDERHEIRRIAGVIDETEEVTATAVGHENGHWTAAVASPILLPRGAVS